MTLNERSSSEISLFLRLETILVSRALVSRLARSKSAGA